MRMGVGDGGTMSVYNSIYQSLFWPSDTPHSLDLAIDTDHSPPHLLFVYLPTPVLYIRPPLMIKNPPSPRVHRRHRIIHHHTRC